MGPNPNQEPWGHTGVFTEKHRTEALTPGRARDPLATIGLQPSRAGRGKQEPGVT